MNRSLLHAVGLAAALLAVSACIAQPQRTDRARRAGPRVPAGVTALRDIPYVENGHMRQKLDLYLPKAEAPLPLIVWVHGGAWMAGSKENCPPLQAGYAEQGYAVASINYRLSSHAEFPAQIEDCKGAIRWLRAHATEHNLDPARIGVWGASAGGHLVALLGTSGDVSEFDVGDNLGQSSRVQAVCDYYGPTDFHAFVTAPGYERHSDANSPEARLIGGLVLENPDKVRRVNPITYVSKDDPPFLIVHGDRDGTVAINQSELLFAALEQAGVPVHFHTIRGAGHGGPGFNAPEVAGMVQQFFDDTLNSADRAAEKPTATKSESRADTTARPAAARSWAAIAARQDRDKDGKISKDEFGGAPALWRRLDRDDDGYVTQREHEAAFPAAKQQQR